MEIKTVRGYLAEKNMDMTDLARELEVSPTHIRNIINGKMKPGKRLARDLESALGGLFKVDVNEEGKCSIYRKNLKPSQDSSTT